MQIAEALKIAHEEKAENDKRIAMLQFLAGMEDGKKQLELEAARAKEDRDEAQKELAKLKAKIEQAQREVEQAVHNVSSRIEDESKRVQAPLQKVKDELRAARAKGQIEKEKLSREIGDLHATKANLDSALKRAEANLRDRQNEDKALEAQMIKTRDTWAQERREMERELAKVGDTEQVKEEIRLARIEAQKVKDELQKEIRELRLAKDRLAKIDQAARV